MLADARDERKPVHARHACIQQHQVVLESIAGRVPDRGQSLSPAGGGGGFHAPGAHRFFKHRPVGLVIIDHQRAPPAKCLHDSRSRRGPRIGGDAHTRGEGERAAASTPAFQANGAAHHRGDGCGNGETESGSAVFSRNRAVLLRERLEDHGLLLFRNADTGIADGERNHALVRCRSRIAGDGDVHRDLARLGELHRVSDQVQDHLPQAQRIGHDRVGDVRRRPIRELEPFLVPPHRQHLNGLGDEIAQAARLRAELEPARLDLREIEEVVDDAEQRFGRCLDHAEIRPLLRRVRHLQQQVRHAEDAVHGRADLVADVGDEFALRLVGRFRGVLRGPQLVRLRVNTPAQRRDPHQRRERHDPQQPQRPENMPAGEPGRCLHEADRIVRRQQQSETTRHQPVPLPDRLDRRHSGQLEQAAGFDLAERRAGRRAIEMCRQRGAVRIDHKDILRRRRDALQQRPADLHQLAVLVAAQKIQYVGIDRRRRLACADALRQRIFEESAVRARAGKADRIDEVAGRERLAPA